jgi:hypothetical protein
MKIPPATLAKMRQAIAPLDTPETRVRYANGDFPRAALVKDLDRRYHWDLLWASKFYDHNAAELGQYNNDHIDTALRAIVPVLEPTVTCDGCGCTGNADDLAFVGEPCPSIDEFEDECLGTVTAVSA